MATIKARNSVQTRISPQTFLLPQTSSKEKPASFHNQQSIVQNQKGQGLIEYLVIVALVGVATIGVMRIVGHNVSIQFANVSRAITGQSGELQGEKVNREHYSKRDLSDFMSNASSSESGGQSSQ